MIDLDEDKDYNVHDLTHKNVQKPPLETLLEFFKPYLAGFERTGEH